MEAALAAKEPERAAERKRVADGYRETEGKLRAALNALKSSLPAI